KHFQLTVGSDFRVELSDRSSRSVSRIGETRLILLFAFSIDSLKNLPRDKRFAPDFKVGDAGFQICGLRAQLQRNTANRSCVKRNVFTNATVAARHSPNEQLFLV